VCDQERDSVSTLCIDLLLGVDASVNECLYDPIDVAYEMIMIQQDVVLERPEGDDLGVDEVRNSEPEEDLDSLFCLMLEVLVHPNYSSFHDFLELRGQCLLFWVL
jgi:hypothetical protein